MRSWRSCSGRPPKPPRNGRRKRCSSRNFFDPGSDEFKGTTFLVTDVSLRADDPDSAGVEQRWRVILSEKLRPGGFAVTPKHLPHLVPDRVYRLWALKDPPAAVEAALQERGTFWAITPPTRECWTEGRVIIPTAAGSFTIRWTPESRPSEPFAFFLDLRTERRASFESSHGLRRFHQRLFPTGSR